MLDGTVRICVRLILCLITSSRSSGCTLTVIVIPMDRNSSINEIDKLLKVFLLVCCYNCRALYLQEPLSNGVFHFYWKCAKGGSSHLDHCTGHYSWHPNLWVRRHRSHEGKHRIFQTTVFFLKFIILK